ncbi:MAG: exopolysaccharide biosynthesis protein [Verrucomicrobiota bacterium]
MPSTNIERSHESLSQTFLKLKESQVTPEGIQMGKIVDAVADRGFGFILMLLALPSALPVPAPGYSTPFGIAIVLLGGQLIGAGRVPWLPQRVRNLRLGATLAEKMLSAASSFLKRVERFIQPRMRWITAKQSRRVLGIIIACMGSLMILPIPLTNTFPAMVVFALAIAIIEEDGLIGIGALAMGCGAVALYAVIVYLVITQGPEVIDVAKDQIKAWLGLSA